MKARKGPHPDDLPPKPRIAARYFVIMQADAGGAYDLIEWVLPSSPPEAELERLRVHRVASLELARNMVPTTHARRFDRSDSDDPKVVETWCK